MDPPFRSRFQARFIDPLGSSLALTNSVTSKVTSPVWEKLRDIVLSAQYASESRHALETVSTSALPPFPQTALLKLRMLIAKFPPSKQLTPGQLSRVLLLIHPSLVYASFQAWALLSRQMEESGLGELGSPSMTSSSEDIGFFGYRIIAIERNSSQTARVTFAGPPGLSAGIYDVPAGPHSFRQFPLTESGDFRVTHRFLGLLTCLFQAHALGWDISLIPPALSATASSSTTTLVKIFGQLLGYEPEVVHLYKEIGGRELVMRRKILQGGATTWEPRSMILTYP